jgi:hypothetical protein
MSSFHLGIWLGIIAGVFFAVSIGLITWNTTSRAGTISDHFDVIPGMVTGLLITAMLAMALLIGAGWGSNRS